VHYSAHFESEPDLLEKACNIGAEGIVSKLKESIYRTRRTHDWVKSKCGLEQEFIIGGYMPAKNNPKAIGALLLGYYKDGKLLYAGKVGTGYDQKTARQIFARLEPLKTARSPFEGKVEKGRRGYVWVRPDVLCEIAFWEWTADRHIRHASFKGLRDDKAPEQVHEEIPEETPTAESVTGKAKGKGKPFTVEGITITHPEREVFPGLGISKGDVAVYYAKAMPYMLPFATERLISLLRCTEGLGSECFFQRAPMKGGKGNVHGLTVDHKESKHNYLYIDSPAGIIELAQMGAMEFHGWQSRVPDINKPDQIIIDLDPAENIPFEAIRLAALDVRNRLKSSGLVSFPRLSGGKGIHITVPVYPEYAWDQVKAFTQDLARQMERDAPDAYISTMSKKKREGKIFVDYLRNDFSATAIIPFSLRARENAPIAVLVSWDELKNIDSAAQFNFSNISGRLNKRTEKLMDDFFNARQKLKL
jgi:bifunctional non-homologous end joining protein LigD